jgi:hypothetical protein
MMAFLMVGVRPKHFFFEKKKQKTFIHEIPHVGTTE